MISEISKGSVYQKETQRYSTSKCFSLVGNS